MRSLETFEVSICLRGEYRSSFEPPPYAGQSEFPRADGIKTAVAASSKGATLYLARIFQTLSTAAREKAASTSLRSLTVLDLLFTYASAR